MLRLWTSSACSCRVAVFLLNILNISGHVQELTAVSQGVLAHSLENVVLMLTFEHLARIWIQQMIGMGGITCVWRHRKMTCEQAVIQGDSLMIGNVEAQSVTVNDLRLIYIQAILSAHWPLRQSRCHQSTTCALNTVLTPPSLGQSQWTESGYLWLRILSNINLVLKQYCL